MGFFGWGRPAWKHRDAEVRLRAVHDLTAERGGVLRDLALNDLEPRVRAAAAAKVSDAGALRDLSARGDAAVKRIASERLSGVAEQQLRAKPWADCGPLLDTITDQKSLAELTLHARDAQVRSHALDRLLAAVSPSGALLATVAIQDAGGELGRRVLPRIDERRLLKDITRKAKHDAVRALATERLSTLASDDGKPSAERLRQARAQALPPLMEQALRLAVTSDLDRAEREWATLATRWHETLAQYSAVPLDAATTTIDVRFQRARQDFAVRATAEHERAASERAAESERQEQAERERVAAIASGALPAATESAAPKIEAVELAPERAAELDALNLEAEQLAQVTAGFTEAIHRFQDLHKRWLMLAADLPFGDSRRERFTAAYAQFKARRSELREQRQASDAEKLSVLTALVAEVEALATTTETLAPDADDAIAAHAQMLTDVQNRWRAVGPLRPALIASLRERYRAALDAAYAPVRAQREASDWERFASLSQAEELTAQVAALVSSEDLAAVVEGVKHAQAAWKKLGPLPRERGRASWDEFHALCQEQFTRCAPLFAQREAERQASLERKRALIVEATALADQGTVGLAGSIADQQAKRMAVERFKAIQAEWRALGPVPRELDREIWDAFRAAGDRFWIKHKAELAVRDQAQVENLQQKTALCTAAEHLATSAETAQRERTGLITPPDVLRRIREIQLQWKAIGHVPKPDVEALWTRFKTAADRCYAAISEYLGAIDAERQDNLARKQAILTEVEEILARENPHWYQDDLRALLRQWRDIGQVPREDMETLARRFAEVSRRMGDGDRAASANSR